jgi:hypothetical protein
MGRIITLADLALEGIEGDEGRLEVLIGKAEAFIEHQTGFRFYSHAETYVLDGNGAEVIVLPQPVISLSSISEDGTLLTSDDYILYNRRVPGLDDRHYPRIAKVSPSSAFDAEGVLAQGATWSSERKAISLVGTFGFTDLVGTAEVAPLEIQHLAIRLVGHLFPRVGPDEEEAGRRIRRFVSEVGGDRSISAVLSDKANSNGPTGDIDIDDVLLRYRHPLTGGPKLVLAFGGA